MLITMARNRCVSKALPLHAAEGSCGVARFTSGAIDKILIEEKPDKNVVYGREAAVHGAGIRYSKALFLTPFCLPVGGHQRVAKSFVRVTRLRRVCLPRH